MMERDSRQQDYNQTLEERDVFGEIFNFRNVLLCTILLGTILVALNFVH